MIHSFQVEMTCDGCSGQVRRILGRLNDGNPGAISDITFDLQSNLVNIKTKLTKDEIMNQLQKTCKPCEYIGSRPSV
uniref:Copper transport protein ATOX1 n=1 Tax=Trichuris muris TaxID=70415 RepID=A0A5S6QJX3_TRIMR